MHNSKGLENLQSHRVHRVIGYIVAYVVAVVWARLQDVTLGRVGTGVSRYMRIRWASVGRMGTELGLALGRWNVVAVGAQGCTWSRFDRGRGLGSRVGRARGVMFSRGGVADFVAARWADLRRALADLLWPRGLPSGRRWQQCGFPDGLGTWLGYVVGDCSSQEVGEGRVIGAVVVLSEVGEDVGEP